MGPIKTNVTKAFNRVVYEAMHWVFTLSHIIRNDRTQRRVPISRQQTGAPRSAPMVPALQKQNCEVVKFEQPIRPSVVNLIT